MGNLTSHAFITYSHWSFGLIFSFILACDYSSPYTHSANNRTWGSTCQQLWREFKIIRFDSSKCLIKSFEKKTVRKRKDFVIASWISLLAT